MKLSDKSQVNSILTNITRAQSQYWKLQKEISSGEKIISVADDPGLSRQIMSLNDTITRVDGYISNIDQTRSELETYESMIDGVVSSVKDLQNLVLKSGNTAAYYDTSKESFREEIDNILKSLLTKANNSVAGKYAFAGSKVDTQPFTANYTDGVVSSVTYSGDNYSKLINLDNNDRISINLSGEEIFHGQAGGSEDIFEELVAIRNDMQDDKFHNIDDHLTNLDNILNRLITKRGEIGNHVKHMDSMETFLENYQLGLEEDYSDMRFTDLAESISMMLSVETTYQGAMEVASRMDKLSIFNYL